MSKLYYSSSEVSAMLELEPSVLRFWEDQFSQLRIKRNRAGKRMYREKDIELIRTIKQLTRDEGYTIAGAKKKLQESAEELRAKKADRGAAQADRDGARADRGAAQAESDGEQAGLGVEKADPGAAQTSSEGAQSSSEGADPRDGRTAASGTAPDTVSGTAPDPELIQWIRSRLIELRESMD